MYYKQIDTEQVEKLLLEKDYNQILRIFFDSLNMSIVQFAARMKCSRRAMGRYLSGERQVPMAIIKQIMGKCNITFNEKETEDEFDKEGYFRWYSELDNLFNTLFLYRTKELGISRFQMACDLNISSNVLREYEHGIKRITPSDVDKILGTYDLRIEELFPMLVTFDGRSTFLPLKPLSCVIFNGTEYDLWESVYSEDDLCNIWPTFPMQRYDSRCQLLMKYMPEELSLDEYVNATDMVFDLDGGYYSRDLSCILQDDEPVGMQFTVELPNDITYLMYFAVDKEYRNQSIGSKALQRLVSSKDKVMLIIERPTDELTERRKNFYLRNGFYSTDIFFEDTGVHYEVLISDKNYKLTEQDLLNRYRCMTNNELTWKRIKSTFNAENIKFIE